MFLGVSAATPSRAAPPASLLAAYIMDGQRDEAALTLTSGVSSVAATQTLPRVLSTLNKAGCGQLKGQQHLAVAKRTPARRLHASAEHTALGTTAESQEWRRGGAPVALARRPSAFSFLLPRRLLLRRRFRRLLRLRRFGHAQSGSPLLRRLAGWKTRELRLEETPIPVHDVVSRLGGNSRSSSRGILEPEHGFRNSPSRSLSDVARDVPRRRYGPPRRQAMRQWKSQL